MALLSFSWSVFAQEIVEVSGVIVDTQKSPLVGVSIAVKDAPGLGTTTDSKGNYKIKVERYKTLVFSSVGYQK